MKEYKYINLFSGIGGWELGFENLPLKNVLSCEIDKYARATFLANFANLPCVQNDNYPCDIRELDIKTIPNFDILIASFPCQSFSMAGQRKGLMDNRDDKGNMFSYVLNILRAKRPQAFIMENVKGLLSSEKGRSFRVVHDLFKNSGYSFHHKIITGIDCGIPQRRQRLFMVGFRDEKQENSTFQFPKPVESLKYTMSDIWEGKCTQDIGFTVLTTRHSKKYGQPYNWMGYMVDGVERRVEIPQIRKLMDIPDSFVFPVSINQQYKQLGNGVIPSVVNLVGESVLTYLQKGYILDYNNLKP